MNKKKSTESVIDLTLGLEVLSGRLRNADTLPRYTSQHDSHTLDWQARLNFRNSLKYFSQEYYTVYNKS